MNKEDNKEDISFFMNHIAASGKCRGIQVARYINGKIKPIEGYENDVCIWVKKIPYVEKIPEKSYVDVVDGEALLGWIQKHPKVGAIASSELCYNYLKELLPKNEIVYIQHHHCNFERYTRPEREVKTVGFIGCNITYNLLPKTLEKDLADIGLDFKFMTRYKSREHVCEFFKDIDIQVCYRNLEASIGKSVRLRGHANLKNSLKVANGASFKIPTVAFPEPSYKIDFDGCFVEALRHEDIVAQCKKLKENKNYYDDIVNKAIEKSEKFHIENVTPLYLSLGK